MAARILLIKSSPCRSPTDCGVLPTWTLVLAEGMGVALKALLVAGVDGMADGALLVVASWGSANRSLLVVDVEAAAGEVLIGVAACIENI